jgi:hypothetical protein
MDNGSATGKGGECSQNDWGFVKKWNPHAQRKGLELTRMALQRDCP